MFDTIVSEAWPEDVLFPSLHLPGLRGEHKVSDQFAEKVIGVGAGGTLELHGIEVVPWTKLTATLPAIANTPGLMLDFKVCYIRERPN